MAMRIRPHAFVIVPIIFVFAVVFAIMFSFAMCMDQTPAKWSKGVIFAGIVATIATLLFCAQEIENLLKHEGTHGPRKGIIHNMDAEVQFERWQDSDWNPGNSDGVGASDLPAGQKKLKPLAKKYRKCEWYDDRKKRLFGE